jgi:hypothetical protein
MHLIPTLNIYLGSGTLLQFIKLIAHIHCDQIPKYGILDSWLMHGSHHMIVLSLLNLVVMLGFCYLYTHPTLIVNID